MTACREPNNFSCLCHKGAERYFYTCILLHIETWCSRHKVGQESVCKHICIYLCIHTCSFGTLPSRCTWSPGCCEGLAAFLCSVGVYHSAVIVHVVMGFPLGAFFRHMFLSTKVNAEPEKQCTGAMSDLASFFWLQTVTLLNLTYD